MSRREVRELTFKLLFQIEFNTREELEKSMDYFFRDVSASEKQEQEIREKVNAILEQQERIDEMIREKSIGWSLERIGKVELTILRLGIYEVMMDEDVPESVAINEAVELAKKFGPEDASGFVNGILAKFVTTKNVQ
ncbi:MAG: transcription antitermination factor NusB [Lachnospiraceae bacterium]